jgi:hypothetical protein
MSELL